MDLKTFKQSTLRAWLWFIAMSLSLFAAVLALIAGLWTAVISNLMVAWGVYWINKLEKELTLRNYPPIINLEKQDEPRDE